MKWLFFSLLASLASVFALMALYIVTDDEKYKSYENFDCAVKDGAVRNEFIPSAITSSATDLRIAYKSDSSNVFLSFCYNGQFPLSQKEWTYNSNQDVQRIFCKARKHFNRNLFEGNLSYFELQNYRGKTIYMAVDRYNKIAYLSL